MSQALREPVATPDVFTGLSCPDFLSDHMYNPETGERGLELHPEQHTAITEMTRMENDMFVYSTWLYSAPKKSGKTTVTAGILLWWGLEEPNGNIIVAANDQKQADSRMFRVIEYTVTHHPDLRDVCKVNRYKITLPNGTIIEAVPVDPAGEAGANPAAIGFTEAWGMKGNKAEMMWSETTLSPSRAGRSFKLVESYAGHSGESVVLERIYNSVIDDKYLIDPDIELYANPQAGIIGYWCTRRIMSWQNDEHAARYYAAEEADKTPAEYNRLHNNQWVQSENLFVPPAWWHDCKGDIPERQQYEAIVLALDAAVSGDTFAMVGVSRRGDKLYKRYVKVWEPPKGGTIDYADIEAELLRLKDSEYIVCVVYDPYQLHDMATRLGSKLWMVPFNQGGPRLIADKNLYDVIRERRLVHDGDIDLTAHVLNANAKEDPEGHKLRIVKRNNDLKIDACVALSMAVWQAQDLNIG